MAPNKVQEDDKTDNVEDLKGVIETLKDENETIKVQYNDAIKELNILRKQLKLMKDNRKNSESEYEQNQRTYKLDASLKSFAGGEDVNNFIFIADIALKNAKVPEDEHLNHLTTHFKGRALQYLMNFKQTGNNSWNDFK